MARPINGSIVFNGSNTKTDSLTVLLLATSQHFYFSIRRILSAVPTLRNVILITIAAPVAGFGCCFKRGRVPVMVPV